MDKSSKVQAFEILVENQETNSLKTSVSSLASVPRDRVAVWKWLALLFGLLSAVLFSVLLGIIVAKEREASIPKKVVHGQADDRITGYQHDRRSELFAELTPVEIQSVLDFLKTRTDLKLEDPKTAGIDSNVVHYIQTKVPEKYEMLDYLNGHGPKPERKATVLIFRGGDKPPSVEEFIVGALPKISYIRQLNSSKRNANVPFTVRPLSTAEFKAAFRHLMVLLAKRAGHILRESYGAMPMKCGDKCLTMNLAPVSSAFIPEGTRRMWFWFQYDTEFASLNPVDFQFLVDMSSVDVKNWEIKQVWYSNQLFLSLEDLVRRYDDGSIRKTRMTFPTPEESLDTSLVFRHPLMPEKPLRAPRQFEPDGPRYVVSGHEVSYLNWKFNYHVSPSNGLQLFNIRFGKERIIYELSLQEVVVMYSGNNPSARVMNYADGAGLYGTRYRGLVPGIDCPAHAKMVDTYLYTANDNGGRVFENALCIYEHNTHLPLRRHRAYAKSGAFYAALEATVLVVRGIVSFINYDYSFDFMFFQNGAIETKISMTGYLGATFFYPEEEEYGAHVRKTVSAGLHNHLFHFKVDLDVKGTKNRFETLDIKTRAETDPWDNVSRNVQTYIERNLKETELSAVSNFNFSAPKYLLISSGSERTAEGVPRSYRLLVEKMSKQMLPEGYGFESSVPWARQQVAVTKYREDEDRSSSVYAMWDASDPVVNFQKYLDDDESLVDEDLVAWVTLGLQHIPNKENLPNTASTGAQLTFHILPYNYFDEDPSMHSRDAVRITPLDKDRPLDGAHVEQYGAFEGTECLPAHLYPLERLKRNSTFIFS